MEICIICRSLANSSSNASDEVTVDCERCGKFNISGTNYAILSGEQYSSISKRHRINASSWIFNNKISNINSKMLEYIFSITPPKFEDKCYSLLLYLESLTDELGDMIDTEKHKFKLFASAWCVNDYELRYYISYLESREMVKSSDVLGRMSRVWIEPSGWIHLENLRKSDAGSSQGFIAMWFNQSVEDVYKNGIVEAIRLAGYSPLRVDMVEHERKIDDEIIAQIRRSKFVVADMTGNRGGVYYEAGFAHGLNLPVFFTCKEGENLHFDIRQYNCIFWEGGNIEEFRDKLRWRIEAVLGKGPSREENP